ncbi:DUF2652 domain-containing protein [Microbacterium sp. BK668]|uniref:DUF2652 domain-containing protein n=1 Tax=Microbacterium sp. BK668 TaxID=2512118 RepID=UPI001060418E|nr:DUF2652 domain-containing protein [Microbacterium sp. BK668]TDN92384.1 uncharacterized protein DUF2652 [Microbacterium sp. BK668]
MTTARTALLIADIGGYTAYMGSHRMSLAHAEVNTARMLRSMIKAARGFDLVEIEGDAAFLSHPVTDREVDGTVDGILRVATAMHRAFHSERKYVVDNLCPCGGCREARDLTLKFVAHIGDVATQHIGGRTKLVGIDVIVAHRLLKAAADIPEYVLITEDLYNTGPSAVPADAAEISSDLEGIGSTHAYVVDVRELGGPVPAAARATWRARLGSTFMAVGDGLPYMIGLRKPRRAR